MWRLRWMSSSSLVIATVVVALLNDGGKAHPVPKNDLLISDIIFFSSFVVILDPESLILDRKFDLPDPGSRIKNPASSITHQPSPSDILLRSLLRVLCCLQFLLQVHRRSIQ